MNARFPVAVRRRIIIAVIVLAVAELAAEVWVTRLTVAGVIVPAVGIVSGLMYLLSVRGRS